MGKKTYKKEKSIHIYYTLITMILGLLICIIINIDNGNSIVKASKVSTFEIKNGVLLKYNGNEEIVTIPETVTKIGEKAFAENKSISKVMIPETVIAMGDNAFKNCDNLVDINLPDSLNKMGTGCFQGCVSLNKIEWSKQLKEIPDYTFMRSGLTEFNFINYQIEKIGKGAFSNSLIKKVWMSDTVKELGDMAFMYCDQLKEIKISENVRVLPESFCQSTSIKTINIPDNVVKINVMAFAESKDLNTINGGINVREIEPGAFYKTKWFNQKDQPLQIGYVYVKDSGLLEQVVIPDKVQMIYDEAFENNYKLKKVILPSSLRIIGENAFYKCKNLSEIQLPEGLEEIRDYAFRQCISIETVTFPENIEIIGDYAFAQCKNLKSYYFPKKHIIFGYKVFYGVEQGNAGEFNEFIVANENTLIAYVDTAVEDELRIPEGVERIGSNVFLLEHSIGKLYIPGTVKIIEKNSFEYAEIDTLVLEDGIKEIEKDGISKCYINTIVIPDSVEKIGSLNIYEYNYNPLTVVCHKGSYAYDYAKKHNITIKLQLY